MFILLTCAIIGIVPAIFHHDNYEIRKQAEWSAFQEYAIPPNSEEVSDDSFNRFKTVVIIKEYKVNSTKDKLVKYYKEKLELAGWRQIKSKNEEVIVYTRGDLKIEINIQVPKVIVWLMYDGDDKDI